MTNVLDIVKTLIIKPVHAKDPTPNTWQTNPLWPEGFFNPTNAGASFAAIISAALWLVFIVAGLFAFFLLIWGGFDLMSSGGDSQKMENGRKRITWAIVGLVVILASWGIIMLIEQMLGFCLGFTCPIALGSFTPS